MLETPHGRGSLSSNFLLGTNTLKVQYLSTNIVREILMVNGPDDEGFDMSTIGKYVNKRAIEKHLGEYFDHDLVVMPFFFDDVGLPSTNHEHVYFENTRGQMQTLCGCSNERRSVLVTIKVLNNQVDLFDKSNGENDNHDISNTVLHAMD